VSVLCGLDRDSITLSERHFQYMTGTPIRNRLLTRIRYGSQVSMGFSVAIPEVSRLVLYPHDHRSLNPFNSSVAFRASLQPHEQPDVALKTARESELADEAGDNRCLPGSSTWHLRRRSAGAVNLYCKFNDFNCDPLGEDPVPQPCGSGASGCWPRPTATVTASSRCTAAGSTRRLGSMRVSRASRCTRPTIWGEEPFGLTDGQFAVLQAVGRKHDLAELRDRLGGQQDVDECVKYLVTRGAL
jgi:hypothetical protein